MAIVTCIKGLCEEKVDYHRKCFGENTQKTLTWLESFSTK